MTSDLFAKTLLFLNQFLYLYPVCMSLVWIVGGVIFYFRRERTPIMDIDEYPFFSILIPCHNEANHLKTTANYLLALDYPFYEIIFVDDGSTDNTKAVIKELCQNHDQIRGVYMMENQGKANALNAAALVSKGEFLMTIDADAILEPQALKAVAWHFIKYPRVGAVTGNPRVLNRTSLLAKIQVGEFATIIGLIKRTQRILGKLFTVSGVVAAFRKTALYSVGFWDADMLTEDIDITWQLEKRFWDVRYEPNCVCWILVPETIRGLWRQRLRWAMGGIEVILKHIDVWKDWRQRRLYPLYLEFILSVFWVYTFWFIMFLWGMQEAFGWVLPMKLLPFFPPRWAGLLLACLCLMQFAVSLLIEHRYEKMMIRYLFWVIWYPFAYWLLNALTQLVGLPLVLLRLKKSDRLATWKSPDRGLIGGR